MSDVKFRPPVITVLGHVDHGKTSLLDRIRHANVQAGEVGGITQAIGAYQIDHQGKILTFIDTPGHAAFSQMRTRGGSVADVAVLVVAADDGVMPQTKESIQIIKQAGIPYVVAINKVDLPDANVLKVKGDLAEVGEYVEGYGGNVPVCEISAKTGQGVDHLLETILLLAELEELTDTSKEPAQAVVIESLLHPQKGPLATLLVKSGVFKVKDELYFGQEKIGKIRSMLAHDGKSLSEAGPSVPCQVLGFLKVPGVGDHITTAPGVIQTLTPQASKNAPSVVDESLRPNIILKADVVGSLEAIIGSLPENVNIVSSSVGSVTESDVQLAVADHAVIVCFNAKANAIVTRLAEVEKVTIVNFGIIYELFDYLKELVENLGKANQVEVLGEAKIVKTFPFNDQIVYGSLVTSGRIRIGDKVGDNAKVISIRIGKESLKEVKKDQECGIILEPNLDLKPGDSIIAHN